MLNAAQVLFVVVFVVVVVVVVVFFFHIPSLSGILHLSELGRLQTWTISGAQVWPGFRIDSGPLPVIKGGIPVYPL